MKKNFQQQILNEFYLENQKMDPFVFVTPQFNEFIKVFHRSITSKFNFSYLFTNVILAPLQTIASSLQLSVSKHRQIFQSKEARTKQLARLNTDLTVHDKRKFQLMIRAGGKSIPYVAPVYNGYKQTIQGLYAQGFRGFYKGLGFRLLTNFLHFSAFYHRPMLLDYEEIKQGALINNIKVGFYCILVDIFINPLYTHQNRYILQNRLPQFRSIKRPFKSFRKLMQKGEAFKGIGFHIINNAIGFFSRYPLYLSIISNSKIDFHSYLIYWVSQLITYPLLTAYRRIQCQTERINGMIPIRYNGLFHALKVISYQQGVKGLWRAFPLYSIIIMSRLQLLKYFMQNKVTDLA